MAATYTIRIGLLICGAFTGPILAAHGDDCDFNNRYWRKITPENCPARVVVESFHTRRMEFPKEEELDDYNLFMITGSTSSAYDDTVPWIRELITFLDGLIKHHPKVRIYGICFGHQILGRVLGGQCIPGDKWEIGPTSVELTDLGRSIFGTERLCLQQMHRDLVPVESLSQKFASGELELLGSTSHTENQGFVKFYPSPSGEDVIKTHQNIHVITVQGHPEFYESVVTGLVRQIAELIGPHTVSGYWGDKGGEYGDEPSEKDGTGRRWHKTDGFDIFALVLWKMLGVVPSSEVKSDTPVPGRVVTY